MGERIPRHIAVIMDGNGRWAKKRLLPRGAGHRAGLKRMTALARHVFDRGAEFCTLFALSTENLARPKEELDGLYALFGEYFSSCVQDLKKQGIALKTAGNLSLLPGHVQKIIEDGVRSAGEGTRGTLILAIAYGGRQDILSAVNRAVEKGEKIDEAGFSALLSTAGIPDPDLLIRTGKEKRISNFLLWQCAYAELYFSDKMFPDFSDRDLDEAIADYSSRERRFGKL